jgi:hypothetical protein
MKVIEDKTFSVVNPEQYTWGHVTNGQVASCASVIVNMINHVRSEGPDRELAKTLVPGMQQSLIEIAQIAEV